MKILENIIIIHYIKMIYNELSKFLRKLRVDKSLTQKDVADYLNISTSFYSSLEIGKKPINENITDKLIKLFDLSKDQILELNKLKVSHQQFVYIHTKDLTDTQVDLVMLVSRNIKKLNNAEFEEGLKILYGT